MKLSVGVSHLDAISDEMSVQVPKLKIHGLTVGVCVTATQSCIKHKNMELNFRVVVRVPSKNVLNNDIQIMFKKIKGRSVTVKSAIDNRERYSTNLLQEIYDSVINSNRYRIDCTRNVPVDTDPKIVVKRILDFMFLLDENNGFRTY